MKYSFLSTNSFVYLWGRMYAVATGFPHMMPTPPQLAVMVLQSPLLLPAVISIHCLLILSKGLNCNSEIFTSSNAIFFSFFLLQSVIISC